MNDRVAHLSPREVEVLQAFALGFGSQERVAELLNISPHTVAAHLGRIYVKYHVRTRAAAVAIAWRIGLIS